MIFDFYLYLFFRFNFERIESTEKNQLNEDTKKLDRLLEIRGQREKVCLFVYILIVFLNKSDKTNHFIPKSSRIDSQQNHQSRKKCLSCV